MCLHADGIKHRIRTPHRFFPQAGGDVLVEVHRFDPVSRCHLSAFRHGIYPNDPVSAMCADTRGQLSHRSEAENGEGSTFWDGRIFDALPSRGQDI